MSTVGQAVSADGPAPGPAPAPAPEMVSNVVYGDNPADLIVNGDFEDYTDPNVPAGWSVDEIYGWRGMYAPTVGWRGTAVRFVRNAQGQHFLAQEVEVQPNHRYTVQMVFQVIATDSTQGGLYVFDSTNGQLVAVDGINRPTNGWRIASLTFDSGPLTRVTVKIGYAAGMNGTAIYDGVRMFEDRPGLQYRYQTTYRDVIGIAAQPADDLVPQLADYVTMLLAAPRAERIAHHNAYAAYLPYYLDQFLFAPDGSGSRSAWCQRTSLALAELLAMYGVPTRQIHVAYPQHEFLEYFDGKKWVVFDSYYGVRYMFNGERLGVDQVSATGMRQVSIEVPTHEHVFMLELGYLLPIWDAGAFTIGISMP
ncbi:MAG TPA: hypothetical protein VLM79_11925 [Kofleriaceae bacterium]|nr:hypothetical protein [Kofleriaceae bacterium]